MKVQLRHNMWILLGQLALLMIAAVVALLLAELWLFGAITLLEAFPQRPVLASGILLSIFAILFLCIRGAKMDSRAIVYFASRAVLLIGSAIAGTKNQTRDQGQQHADHDSLGPNGGHARLVHTPSRSPHSSVSRLSSQHGGWFFG